ncbi:uncharacterized protein LOC126259767 [Schistocerca nitens]|uniref:uncharacterized protein LOC126259767 n=1 Tax=Schistocerca nitens TaxID=7011 RepID=UPI002117A2E1|nr:uncharacterized protein LOC126259767 [Schistocerca nitens]XP_049812729.1 uncharacterized protein LOC126259767 [Schistocerca nitens]
MLLSNEKPEFSNSGETSSSVDEQLLENVKPNLISLTSSGSYSSNLFSDMGNHNADNSPTDLQNMVELQSLDGHGISLKDVETSLDSFTVILEEPIKYSQTSLNGNATNSNILQSGEGSHICASPSRQRKHSVNTPDLLENCSQISAEQSNGGKTRAETFRYLKRNWSSVQDLSTLPFYSQKNEPEFTYLTHNPCQSSTTISSVQKSKDSGLPRSLSCLSLGSGVKPYDHVQSKVREYISQIKKTESERKKNIEISCSKREDGKSFHSSIQQEPEEDLRHIICKLQEELNDKNNIISQIQENYDALLMKYADAENRIDRLRFKVIDSSVEEIRSHRTQDDFSIWNNEHSKSSLVNQSYSERAGFHDRNLHLRRNLFQRSFLSGSSSLPSAANMRPNGQENFLRNLSNDANFTPELKTSSDFLAVNRRLQEDIALPFLAISTPNHSFSKPESSAEFQQLSLRESVTELENMEDKASVNCTEDCVMRREEENLSSEDILLNSHIPHNLSLGETKNVVRSGDQETIANICSVVSDRLRETKSFFSKDFSDSEEHKASSSENSILKVKQWQESLPPPELIEPSCYDTLPNNCCNSIKETSKNDSTRKAKRGNSKTKKHYDTEFTCLEEMKLPKPVPHQIPFAFTEHRKDSPNGKNLLTNRSFSKNLITNIGLSYKQFFRSEPDLRLIMNKSSVDNEAKSHFGNIMKISSHRMPTNTTTKKTGAKTVPGTYCEIKPLRVEPCYCWDKSALDLENESHLKHCDSSIMLQENNISEHTVPHLKLGDFMDIKMDDLKQKMDVNDIHNSDIPSFVYSPSTSMSSTAVYSGCKHKDVGKDVKTFEDSSTSYKNIQRKCTSVNKRPRGTVCCSKTDSNQHKSAQNGSCPCVCQMDNLCHDCKNIEQHKKYVLSTPYCAANSFWHNCCSHVVPKHSCGVNTETTLHTRMPEHTSHKYSLVHSFCSCGVNTDKRDLTDSATFHVEFVSRANDTSQKKKHDSGDHNGVVDKIHNNFSNKVLFVQHSPSATKMSNEQSPSAVAAITDQDARDLAQCLEEVNNIASLLKAQSESIIEVVTANLADHVGSGETRVFDVSGIP